MKFQSCTYINILLSPISVQGRNFRKAVEFKFERERLEPEQGLAYSIT